MASGEGAQQYNPAHWEASQQQAHSGAWQDPAAGPSVYMHHSSGTGAGSAGAAAAGMSQL
jgi:hypothetical protein